MRKTKTGGARQPSIAAWFTSPVQYKELNARQKENYNFLKLSAILADYGFVTMRLSADWEGADFIAQHNSGELFLKVQLKGRLCFSKKYQGKGLYIAFRDGNGAEADWYLLPHDEVLHQVLAKWEVVGGTRSWCNRGEYHWGRLSHAMREFLACYRLPKPARP